MSRPRRLVRLAAVAVAALGLLSASAARGATVKETHPVLGALLRVQVDADDEETARSQIRNAVAVARHLEAQFSVDDEASALSRLNAMAGRGRLPLPLDLYRLLALSRLMSRSTGGAFDVTVGPLLQRRGAEPDDPAARLSVVEALALVGADRLTFHSPSAVELPLEGMAVDLGAIARGYVLERMAASLRAGGAATALLEIGDAMVLAVGPGDEQPPFRVRISRGRSTVGSVALRDRALSTTRSRPRAGDSSEPPILDPRSGRVVDVERQATVIARDAAIAQAWSTALVVDPDGTLSLIGDRRDVEALVFDEHGEHSTPRFEDVADWKPEWAGGP